ncbi:GNAT domain-containing protein [Coniochaeta sp. 2T2.1]|nr:GNAT domain-containing protein [Coniochaeta sp. 2T2.1]
MTATPNSHRVLIRTTLPLRPLPPNSSRAPITTARLLIRPLVPEDVHSLHVLRTQPEVMRNNPQGRPDADLEATRARLIPFLPPVDEGTFHFAICLRETSEMIGIGGCYNLSGVFGWPAIGYQLRREYWGRGLMTEFVRAWLGMWEALPRESVEVLVDPDSSTGEERERGVARELVTSSTIEENVASRRVLEKSGFACFKEWREADLRDLEVEIGLRGFRYVVQQHAGMKG